MHENKARRSGRLHQVVPILLIGSDAEGRFFSERTHTVVLSSYGAGIVSANQLVPEQLLILRDEGRNREAEIRVVGEIGQEGGRYTYGVAFLDEQMNFWEVDFPPAPPPGDKPEVLSLECSGCGRLVDLANRDFEYDVCTIHGGLARYCEECGFVTVWRPSPLLLPCRPRVATGGLLAVPPSPKQGALALAEGQKNQGALPREKAGDAERRGRGRAKVNFYACVQSEKYGREVVSCVDMSRGGVSFRSRNDYERGIHIQIAVPYAAEAQEVPAIFVPARVVHVHEMHGICKVGVQFLEN